MIHETLVYLLHCPRELIDADSEQGWMNMLNIEEFLHPGEKQLLQQIIAIGLSYHKIQDFIKIVNEQDIVIYESSCDEVIVKREAKAGLYLKAFCDGVDEVLDDYRNVIINLERKYLENPPLSLTFVLGSIERYITLFKAIKSMINLIKREQIHGCLLMGKLQTYIDCGMETVAESVKRIMKSISKIFNRQLGNWIIYGDLIDMYDEFFICDANCADENFLDCNGKATPANDGNMESFQRSFKSHKVRKSYTVKKYYLKIEMVPENITLDIAETILFLGRVVWIIRNDPRNSSDNKMHTTTMNEIWSEKDKEYYDKLQVLEDCSNLAQFNKTIEECRLKVTKHLWKIMVEEAHLLDHLQLIRDYFALGRGELFQQFIVIAENHIRNTTNDYIITDLNFIFTETARKLYSEHDKTYLRFELTLPQTQEKTELNIWSQLKINFDVDWPLHILFHPEAMNLYNKLFCFLLRIKKTHIDLHKLWLEHIYCKKKIDPRVWSLRNNLMFIVNNLQYYFQVDVIETHFSILKNALQNANEFEGIIRLHSKFLKDLLNKTFIMVAQKESVEEMKHTLYQTPNLTEDANNMVYKIILQILHLCDRFCKIVSSWSSELLKIQKKELAELETESNTLIDMLLHVLRSLHENTCGHHLLQLLRHIDFNRWFSKNNEQLNLTVSF